MKNLITALLLTTAVSSFAKGGDRPAGKCESTRAQVAEFVAEKLGKYSISDVRWAAEEFTGQKVTKEDVSVEHIIEVSPTDKEVGAINVLYKVAQGGDYFTQIAFRSISFKKLQDNVCIWNADVLMMKTYKLKKSVEETDFSNRKDFNLISPRDAGMGKVKIPLP